MVAIIVVCIKESLEKELATYTTCVSTTTLTTCDVDVLEDEGLLVDEAEFDVIEAELDADVDDELFPLPSTGVELDEEEGGGVEELGGLLGRGGYPVPRRRTSRKN